MQCLRVRVHCAGVLLGRRGRVKARLTKVTTRHGTDRGPGPEVSPAALAAHNPFVTAVRLIDHCAVPTMHPSRARSRAQTVDVKI